MSLPVEIDISKEKLDIYANGAFSQIKNTPEAIKTFFKKEAREYQISDGGDGEISPNSPPAA